MAYSETLSRMFDATIRVEAIWPFPNHEAPEWLAETMEDLGMGQLPAELREAISKAGIDTDDFFDGYGRTFLDAWEHLCCEASWSDGKKGWLGLVSSPVYRKSAGGASHSWSCWRNRLFFAETAEGIIEQGCGWGEALFAECIGETAVQNGGAA